LVDLRLPPSPGFGATIINAPFRGSHAQLPETNQYNRQLSLESKQLPESSFKNRPFAVSTAE
jgi:hypothetical protein